jgi:hypothetical protein
MPDGDYNAIVVESSATTSSTGKPMIKVKFRVMDGPHKDKPIWSQFVISPESPIALRIFFQHMAAFGLDANFFAQQPPMDSVARNLLNRGVVLTLDSREWGGALRNNVKGISPLSAGGPIAPGVVTGPPIVGVSPMSLPGSTPSPTSTPTVPTTPTTPTAPSNIPTPPKMAF